MDNTQPQPEVSTQEKPNTLFGMISYISILCLIPILAQDKTPFVRFHVKQGIVLLIIEVIANLLAWSFLFGWIARVVLFLCVIASLYGIYIAYQGKQQEMPIIGGLAKKINF